MPMITALRTITMDPVRLPTPVLAGRPRRRRREVGEERSKGGAQDIRRGETEGLLARARAVGATASLSNECGSGGVAAARAVVRSRRGEPANRQPL